MLSSSTISRREFTLGAISDNHFIELTTKIKHDFEEILNLTEKSRKECEDFRKENDEPGNGGGNSRQEYGSGSNVLDKFDLRMTFRRNDICQYFNGGINCFRRENKPAYDDDNHPFEHCKAKEKSCRNDAAEYGYMYLCVTFSCKQYAYPAERTTKTFQ
ncbi:hypothetical protein AGMMS50239_35090 [Bacteroidia bacterium]|nr:hypothetical protein AGMMS50239_35090 [Bacteroidia bacterium]